MHEKRTENGFKNNPKSRAETDKSRSYKTPSTKDSKSRQKNNQNTKDKKIQ